MGSAGNGEATSQPHPLWVLVGGAHQRVQRMRSSVGPVPGTGWGPGGGGELSGRACSCTLLPAFPRWLQAPPPVPTVSLARLWGPSPPRPPAQFPCDSGGWSSAWKRLSLLSHKLPAAGQTSPPFLWDGTAGALLSPAEHTGLERCFRSGKTWCVPLRKDLACPRVWPAGLGQGPRAYGAAAAVPGFTPQARATTQPP